jgi:hypothetical protein
VKCKNFERRSTKPRTNLEDMMQLWRDVAVAVAGADATKDKHAPGLWATKVVDDYAGYLLAIEKARRE